MTVRHHKAREKKTQLS